jgi:hypothetical protein
MATYDLSNAAVALLGTWQYAYITSQRALVCSGTGSEIEFTATGTDCTLTYAVSATGTNYLQASIDGAAFADITGPVSNNTYTACTLFTGLSDAAHTVRVKHNTGTSTNVRVQHTAGITITGGAPAIALTNGLSYGIGRGQRASTIQQEGHVVPSNSAGHDRLALQLPDSRIRFKSDATSIAIFSSLNSAKLRVMQDGVAIGAATTLGASGYGKTTLATGLSGSHTYEIVCVTATISYLISLQTIGGTLDSSAPAFRSHILWVGDSKAMGASGTTDSSICWPSLVGGTRGFGTMNLSTSGVRVLSPDAGGSIEWNAPFNLCPITDPRDYAYLVFCGGHNDAAAGIDRTEFTAAVVRELTALSTAYPNAIGLAMGILNTTTFSTTVRNNYNSDISSAVTTVGGIWTYVNTDGWITPATDCTDASTHPNATGHGLIKTQLLNSIAAYSASSGFLPRSTIIQNIGTH